MYPRSNLLGMTIGQVSAFIDVWEPHLTDDQKREILKAVDRIREVLAWHS